MSRRISSRASGAGWVLGLTALLGVTLPGCKDGPLEESPPAGEYEPAPAAQDSSFWSPFDAAPSPQADMVYFTALTADGPGVFRVAAENGTPEALFVGAPLVSPFGIMPDATNTNVFVVDSGSEGIEDEESEALDDAADPVVGRIFRISTAGGETESLTGAEGTAPKSLDVVRRDGRDLVYFTGIDPESGAAAVFSMDADGGERTLVASGAPLVDPSGIAVASDGTIYVADVAGDGGLFPSILRIRGGVVEVYQQGLLVGYPAGVALTLDEKALFVSGLKEVEGTSVVHVVDLTNDSVAEFDKNIGQNTQSAGVHRAHATDAFAWANADGDEDDPQGGTVYFIPRR